MHFSSARRTVSSGLLLIPMLMMTAGLQPAPFQPGVPDIDPAGPLDLSAKDQADAKFLQPLPSTRTSGPTHDELHKLIADLADPDASVRKASTMRFVKRGIMTNSIV